MTIKNLTIPNPRGRQTPLRLLHLLQFASPEALITALKTWDWPVDEADNSGLSLLFRAVLLGRMDHFEILLSAGANINCQDCHGWTPLFWAVYRDDWEIVSLLLLSGADPSRTDIGGRDVFRLAASLGWELMLTRLQAYRSACSHVNHSFCPDCA